MVSPANPLGCQEIGLQSFYEVSLHNLIFQCGRRFPGTLLSVGGLKALPWLSPQRPPSILPRVHSIDDTCQLSVYPFALGLDFHFHRTITWSLPRGGNEGREGPHPTQSRAGAFSFLFKNLSLPSQCTYFCFWFGRCSAQERKATVLGC